MTLSSSLLTLSIPSVLRTFRRRPALKMRPWHLVSANLRDLKIGYPCSLRFTCDESYTVHLLFSTKSRLGGLPGGGAPLQGAGPSSQLLSRVSAGSVDRSWMAAPAVSWCCASWSSSCVCVWDCPQEDARKWRQHEARSGALLTRDTWWYLKRGLPWCIRFILWRIIHGWPFFRYQIWPWSTRKLESMSARLDGWLSWACACRPTYVSPVFTHFRVSSTSRGTAGPQCQLPQRSSAFIVDPLPVWQEVVPVPLSFCTTWCLAPLGCSVSFLNGFPEGVLIPGKGQ